MYNFFGVNKTVFAGPSKDKNSIWAAIFEKAWAKMKGNYLSTESGYMSEGINALTGVPVFEYDNLEINETFWDVVNAADKANYIMQASTVGTG